MFPMKNREAIELTCEQRTAEWYEARRSTQSASSVDKILSKTQRKKYVYKLLGERVTGLSVSFEPSAPMIRGIVCEGTAQKAYRDKTGRKVTETGFIFANKDKIIGASPDGFVTDIDGTTGLIEIKCPDTSTHLEYCQTGCPKKYRDQIHFQMLVTGEEWCDFVSWDDRVTEEFRHLETYIERIYRDEKIIDKIREATVETRELMVQYCDKIGIEL